MTCGHGVQYTLDCSSSLAHSRKWRYPALEEAACSALWPSVTNGAANTGVLAHLGSIQSFPLAIVLSRLNKKSPAEEVGLPQHYATRSLTG